MSIEAIIGWSMVGVFVIGFLGEFKPVEYIIKGALYIMFAWWLVHFFISTLTH